MKNKFFTKEKNFKKESLGLNINLYWKLAVCAMCIVAFASFFFGRYFFIQINQESVMIPSQTAPQVETIKKDRIEKVLNYFREREQKSNQILNSGVSVVDPSL